MKKMKSKQEMEKMLSTLVDESIDYSVRLEAYEYLQEDCEELVDTMLEKFYASQGETADMLIEILSEYPGHKGVYMGLVSYLYRGEDVALYARLIGKYGDEAGIEVLKSFAESGELNYNEYMEIRNAVEELGGYFEDKESNYQDDEFYRYLKGLDEPDDESRRSPFENILNPEREDEECDEECDDECDHDCDNDCDDECDHDHDHHCHDHNCDCHH
jgi:hypothetical protein